MIRLRIFALALVAVALSAVAAAAPALAVENLYEKATKSVLIQPGTNFYAEAVGEPELKSSVVTVKCKKSEVSGTVATNTSGVAPTAKIQSAVFEECKETTGLLGNVDVLTETEPAWTLEWVSAKKVKLTGIKAKIQLKGIGVTCGVENKAGSNFELTWINGVPSELEALKQLLTVTGGISCPTSGEETARYKIASVGDTTNNVVLE
jgi:hypothetical protein